MTKKNDTVSSLTLQRILDLHIKENILSEATISKYNSVVKIFIKQTGIRDIDALTRNKILLWRDDVLNRSTNRQALEAITKIQNEGLVKSVGTNRNYLTAFKNIAKNTTGNLRDLTKEQAVKYLVDRSAEVGQKSLDMSRQAMQHLIGEKLPVIKTEKIEALEPRAYTSAQVQMIVARQNERNALSTQIVYASGLRAHELLTLQPLSHQSPDARVSDSLKFSQRDGEIYTVKGYGLVREVLIPSNLTALLEQNKLALPVNVVDRGVNYEQHYNIAGGNNWSKSFSISSNLALGWSKGAHGIRHSYAQERMQEIKAKSTDQALRIVSQEMGHFRPDITLVYLR